MDILDFSNLKYFSNSFIILQMIFPILLGFFASFLLIRKTYFSKDKLVVKIIAIPFSLILFFMVWLASGYLVGGITSVVMPGYHVNIKTADCSDIWGDDCLKRSDCELAPAVMLEDPNDPLCQSIDDDPLCFTLNEEHCLKREDCSWNITTGGSMCFVKPEYTHY